MNVRDLKERLAELGPELDLLTVKYLEHTGVDHTVTHDIDIVVVHGGHDVTLEAE